MSQLLRVAVTSCMLAAGLTGSAHAFSDPAFYGKYPSQQLGGGGNRFFTGSPADGYACSVCHTAPTTYSFPLYQTGLPVDGYIPGTTYNVTLSWPEAALWAGKNGTPMTALAAEFVAEDAGESGSLRLQTEAAIAPTLERCVPRPGETVGELAASIYWVQPGLDTQQIIDLEQPCVTDGVQRDRCVITVKPCGTSQVQMRWTAPAVWGGPIWFSASFVSTDVKTSRPNDFDYVTELSIPINSAITGPGYETQLESGCSTAGTGPRNHSAGAWIAMLVLGIFVRRRPRFSAAVSGSIVALLCFAGGCAEGALVPGDALASATVGAFEPGDRLDSGVDATVGGGICKLVKMPATEADAGSEPGGTLAVSFTTTPPVGNPVGTYDIDGTKPSLGVVWIEDALGAAVKTLEFWGKNYLLINLQPYLLPRLNCDFDVVTQATIRQHQLHMLTWDGKSADGFVVPDGNYVLHIDVQVDEAYAMAPVSVPFTVGRAPWTVQVPDVPPHAGLTLAYTPNK